MVLLASLIVVEAPITCTPGTIDTKSQKQYLPIPGVDISSFGRVENGRFH